MPARGLGKRRREDKLSTEPEELRERRLALNEAVFRDVNERIEKATERFAAPTTLSFICECVDKTCTRHLELTREEYEALRSDPRHFAVAPDHDDPELENVVERHKGFIVVEKFGAGAEVATATDPRRAS